MPMNPMQRRARNSFLIGFLVALVIMAIVVMFLLQRIKSINDAKEAIEKLQKKVYVATEDLESGRIITSDDFATLFKQETVQTTMDVSQVLSISDFDFLDDEGNVITKVAADDGGEPKEVKKEFIMKIDVPSGAMVTKDMVTDAESQITDDLRIQEFNMILLPSQLKNGDYIDVRYNLPGGEDYIVLAKKKVIYTTQTGVWLKLSEEEILTMGNAIVEAYGIAGSKIYALKYVEPGLQAASTPTFPVNRATFNLIETSPNILQTAKDGLYARYNEQGQVEQRNDHINPLIPEVKQQQSSVQSGNKNEQSITQTDRENFVKSLEGTDKIGTASY